MFTCRKPQQALRIQKLSQEEIEACPWRDRLLKVPGSAWELGEAARACSLPSASRVSPFAMGEANPAREGFL